jgi:hypothetical protein
MIFTFPNGVRVLSRATGEMLQQFEPGARLIIRNGRFARYIMSKAEWVRRELAKASFSTAQTALLKRLKRDLSRDASAIQ